MGICPSSLPFVIGVGELAARGVVEAPWMFTAAM